MPALRQWLASRLRRDDIELAVAVFGALFVGVAATATLHSAVGPTRQFGQSGALQWTSPYSVNNAAPLVGAALGFDAGRRTGLQAVGGSFVGSAAGYLVFFLGTYAVNGLVLDVTRADLLVSVLAADAVGVGLTAAVVAVVAARLA